MVGKRFLANLRDPKDNEARDGDLETGFASKRPRPSFKDAVNMVMANRTTAVLKQQLQSGVDRDEFEKYRMDEDEIKQIKNKKLRQYYEAQNERLNDWLEVDTVVKAMADSIFDSMNQIPTTMAIEKEAVNARTSGNALKSFSLKTNGHEEQKRTAMPDGPLT